MSFLVLPPEVNSARMFLGAGSGPMLSAAAAWDGLAAELQDAASSFASVTSGLAGQAWQGPASAAMAAAAAPYTGWLSAAAAQAAGAAGQAQAMVSAFEAAQAATVQPILVALNRNSLVQMVLSNWFGLNAPAIAAAEGEYEQMWAQDVAAMAGYHADASAAAAQLTPFQQMLQSLPAQAASAAAQPGAVLPDPFPNSALSIDGMLLLQSGSATAKSGPGNAALAIGANSSAFANPKSTGFLSFATAIGNNDTATANGILSTATVMGNNSTAGTGAGSMNCTAIVTANNSTAGAGSHSGDFGDTAIVYGSSTANSLAFAGSGSLNTALTSGFGNQAYAGGSPFASGGASNVNFALVTGENSNASAGLINQTGGDFNFAQVLNAYNSSASAGDGTGNSASVIYGALEEAEAGYSNSNLATVLGIGGDNLSAIANAGGQIVIQPLLPPV
jgi:PPE-repeat protein